MACGTTDFLWLERCAGEVRTSFIVADIKNKLATLSHLINHSFIIEMTSSTRGTKETRLTIDAIVSNVAASDMRTSEKKDLKTLVGKLEGWTEEEVMILVLRILGICMLTGLRFYFFLRSPPVFFPFFFDLFFSISPGGRRLRFRQNGRRGEEAEGDEATPPRHIPK